MTTPVCDLVLLSWNHLEETRACLGSLFKTTRVPCRLLIVDNGSEPDVRSFLGGVKGQASIQEVVLLQNERNEGFPKGMNRGIQASTAPVVCLLNNDLLFTTGWLEELLAVARANPRLGVLNPASNNFGNVPPKGMTLEQYAEQRRGLHAQFTEVGMCIGFCMLIKREVIDQIGGLDEQVERIFFEDEDYGMRAQQAGYQCGVAAAAYVYHAEHTTVRPGPERDALFARNRAWCEARWGRRIRIAWPQLSPIEPGSAELRAWLERLIAWARRRTHVYVYSPLPAGIRATDLFRSVDLVPHADVHWHAIPTSAAPLAAMGMVLKRQKKRFDVIAAPNSGWAQAMNRLRWLHHATVVQQDDEEALIAQWQHASHSPLSS